ncbi:ABC-type transport auxiliary lipoprotein family protein [Castellaniella caeni]|uniref:ABC-type transport auxiliary lipoprotein family protein n=1 Tax=Castellaniella caeni TaxID=266123 RepID=UPI0015E08280|nr:ABC-type transport auxiliary lipoprotein family protein [Castellaniella caeni]
MRRAMLLCGALGLLAGCTTTPSRYYSLSEAAFDAGGAQVAPALLAAEHVQLRVVRIPAETERPQLLVRVPAQAPAVEVLNDSLWASPLADEIQAALAARLAAAGSPADAPRAAAASGRPGQPVRRVDVRVTRFDLVWGLGAGLDASWTDRLTGAPRTRVCQARLRVPAAQESVAALVEAQRQAVRALGRVMAASDTLDTAGLPPAPELRQYGCTLM